MPQSRPGFWRSNRGTALVLLGLTAILGGSIWFSEWAHQEMRDGFTLGGFPLFAVAMMAISLFVMLFDGEAENATSEVLDLHWSNLLVVLGAVASIGLAFLAIPYLGFVASITLLVTLGAIALRFRPVWLAIAVGLGTALFLRGLLFALGVGINDGPFSLLFQG